MTCCGDRRARLAQGIRAAQSVPASAPPAPGGARVPVRYLGPVPMVLRGPVSGELYRLTGTDVATELDPRDVAALLRTRWFRRSA